MEPRDLERREWGGARSTGQGEGVTLQEDDRSSAQSCLNFGETELGPFEEEAEYRNRGNATYVETMNRADADSLLSEMTYAESNPRVKAWEVKKIISRAQPDCPPGCLPLDPEPQLEPGA
ncbi:MAG: hypothetical protein M1816_001223 [Peltula sp. TS41687]|nr:MAG: hypothetical protein M1816_001223 [Peltula sp. TS41687]